MPVEIPTASFFTRSDSAKIVSRYLRNPVTSLVSGLARTSTRGSAGPFSVARFEVGIGFPLESKSAFSGGWKSAKPSLPSVGTALAGSGESVSVPMRTGGSPARQITGSVVPVPRAPSLGRITPPGWGPAGLVMPGPSVKVWLLSITVGSSSVDCAQLRRRSGPVRKGLQPAKSAVVTPSGRFTERFAAETSRPPQKKSSPKLPLVTAALAAASAGAADAAAKSAAAPNQAANELAPPSGRTAPTVGTQMA